MPRAVKCPACGHMSDVIFRCSECGHDLVEEEPVTADEAAVGTAPGGDA